MKSLKKVTLLLSALNALSGFATFEPGSSDDTLYMSSEAQKTARKKKVLLTLGGVVLAGVIIAHEGRDGAKDALRDAARP